MDELTGIFFRITNAVILARYYAAFLIPKSKRFSRGTVFTGFGIVYFIFQYLIYFCSIRLLAEIPVHFISFTISIILYLVVFFSSSVFFKKDLGMQIYLLCSFFVVQEICYFISLCLYNLFGRTGYIIADSLAGQGVLTTTSSFQNKFNILALAVHLLSYAAIYILSMRGIIKSFSHKRQYFSLIELLYLILPCLSGFMLVFIMRAISYTPDSNSHLGAYVNVPYIEFLMPLAGFIFLVSLIATVRLFQKLAELGIEESEKLVLRKQTQQLQEQIKDVNGIYTEIRGMRHDMKDHISNIKLLIKAIASGNHSAGNELEEYLSQFGEALDKFEFIFQTGNSISDVIVHQKYTEAIDNNIEFLAEFVYPTQLNLDAYDLAVILNNGLENAVEACKLMAYSNRFIKLYSYTKGEMFFIEIENSFSGQIIFHESTYLPVSGKLDKGLHGMGIPNIQRCARKYYGDVDIQIREEKEQSIFHLIVMLQSKE